MAIRTTLFPRPRLLHPSNEAYLPRQGISMGRFRSESKRAFRRFSRVGGVFEQHVEMVHGRMQRMRRSEREA